MAKKRGNRGTRRPAYKGATAALGSHLFEITCPKFFTYSYYSALKKNLPLCSITFMT
jgi:hypothetical protein